MATDATLHQLEKRASLLRPQVHEFVDRLFQTWEQEPVACEMQEALANWVLGQASDLHMLQLEMRLIRGLLRRLEHDQLRQPDRSA